MVEFLGKTHFLGETDKLGLGELSDVPVEIRPLRTALEEPELFVALRLKLEDQ